MSNRLSQETSPYLLQHKENPVDWYPWCREAFERAEQEDKPIFLSIGYSACHWCHVIAHESFEDAEIADLLNRYFISIKVDKEERPDIDSVYMAVCQAFTGSGGWPTSIFMTPDQKPFFAGTYFPKTARNGMLGLKELLSIIHEAWISDRDRLLQQSDKIITHLNQTAAVSGKVDIELTHYAVEQLTDLYDEKHGGFGRAPKFPTPHNLLFLLEYDRCHQTTSCLPMVERTLLQMYRGGLFDHIGGGFCRYSTDNMFLVPHFEKMLYDNALLILAYCQAYAVTNKSLYLSIAEKIASYILRDMTAPDGGFYSSQDADSEGREGEYYLLTPQETIDVLGEANGKIFNRLYDITEKGNFEGKNIPNLLKSDVSDSVCEPFLPILAEYRKRRYALHRDEKILTAWNGLMIAALCKLYLVSKKEIYRSAAQKAERFIQKNLWEGDTLFVSFHANKRGVRGFLDDYAACMLAELALYRATLEYRYFENAKRLCDKVLTDFRDDAGGFFLYSKQHEALILRPKETYDGAIPSGNSLMAYNLVCMSLLVDEERYKQEAELQLDFLAKDASQAPAGHTMYLKALLDHRQPPTKVTIVSDEQTDIGRLPLQLPVDALVVLMAHPTKEYPLKNGQTTYYVCQGYRCLPPTNNVNEWM